MSGLFLKSLNLLRPFSEALLLFIKNLSGKYLTGDRVRLAQKKQGTSPRQQLAREPPKHRDTNQQQTKRHQAAPEQTHTTKSCTDAPAPAPHCYEKKQPGKAREPKAAKAPAAAPEEKKTTNTHPEQ